MSCPSDLTHLSLFSGIGGLDIAAEKAGFCTVGQCEWADYPTKVLEKHWPDVSRWRDIRTLTGESFYEHTVRRTVDIISGGFPCQPFSVAGQQRGKSDDRYLWPEMLRVIGELAPRWVVGENVPGIINLAADDVCADLERAGYEVWIFNFEAAAVGAPHRRDRVAFVAHANSARGFLFKADGWRDHVSRQDRETQKKNVDRERINGPWEDGGGRALANTSIEREGRLPVQPRGSQQAGADADRGSEVCHTTSPRLPNGPAIPMGGRKPLAESQRSDWWATEPDVGRVANGISGRLDGHWAVEPPHIPRVVPPHDRAGRKAVPAQQKNRVDRLKCLGNAVVPQQFYPIFKAIYDVETTPPAPRR